MSLGHFALVMIVHSQPMHSLVLLCLMLNRHQVLTSSLGMPLVSQIPYVVAPSASHTPTLEPPAELLAAVFPWVEQEQDRLTQRQASCSNSDDIALKQFLRLLLWLRRVLLQDCAILMAKYPSCPLFQHPPFNSPVFQQFSSSALSVVDKAEEEARHALKNLPDNIAASFRGLATDIKMDQHSQRIDTAARLDALDSQLDQVKGLLQQLIGLNSSKGGSKAKQGFCFHLLSCLFHDILIQTW